MKKLQIWGDTASGKTTLITGAIFSDPGHRAWNRLDMLTSRPAIWEKLQDNWDHLIDNKLKAGTAEQVINIPLSFKATAEQPIETCDIIDIKGGTVKELRTPRMQQLIQEADGILFVVPWKRGDLAVDDLRKQLEIVRTVAGFSREKPMGLAVTKCEQVISSAQMDVATVDPLWWQMYPIWQEYADILNLLSPHAIWPTSVYGYNRQRNASQPACLLGEFGQTIPYNIKPINVIRPFEWFLEQWEMCP